MTACATSASARKCTRSTPAGRRSPASTTRSRCSWARHTSSCRSCGRTRSTSISSRTSPSSRQSCRRRAAADRRAGGGQASGRARPGLVRLQPRSLTTRDALGRGDERKARAALFLLLTLRGSTVLYQGDELALLDGAVPAARTTDVADPPRDPERTPLPWTPTGSEWREPWLPLADSRRNVEDQRADPGSTLNYVRALIARRRAFADAPYDFAAECRRGLGLRARRCDLRAQPDR